MNDSHNDLKKAWSAAFSNSRVSIFELRRARDRFIFPQ